MSVNVVILAAWNEDGGSSTAVIKLNQAKNAAWCRDQVGVFIWSLRTSEIDGTPAG